MSLDPTAFPIQFDPREQRMVGIARHGDTPFDVPFISQIDGNLWQGGCTNGLVLPPFIDHLVSLYPWEAYTVRHELQSALTVRQFDSLEDENTEQLYGIARWINTCRADGPTLVHCQAGLNRSSRVAALALILDGMAPDAAVALLREKRSPAVLCNPAFEAWVRQRKAP